LTTNYTRLSELRLIIWPCNTTFSAHDAAVASRTGWRQISSSISSHWCHVDRKYHYQYWSPGGNK